jgi:hypothetical protein
MLCKAADSTAALHAACCTAVTAVCCCAMPRIASHHGCQRMFHHLHMPTNMLSPWCCILFTLTLSDMHTHNALVNIAVAAQVLQRSTNSSSAHGAATGQVTSMCACLHSWHQHQHAAMLTVYSFSRNCSFNTDLVAVQSVLLLLLLHHRACRNLSQTGPLLRCRHQQRTCSMLTVLSLQRVLLQMYIPHTAIACAAACCCCVMLAGELRLGTFFSTKDGRPSSTWRHW